LKGVQGSQFTSTVFTDAVLSRGIALSMDSKGSWRDNVFVETIVAKREVRRGVSEGV
jgi:transposase InsO family protein